MEPQTCILTITMIAVAIIAIVTSLISFNG